MRAHRSFFFLALVLASGLATAAPAQRRRVAVMDVAPLEGVRESAGSIITELVTTELAGAGGYEVVSRGDIANLLGFEKQKALLGCSDGSCLAEIGGALGVDLMVTGQVGLFGTRYRLALTVQDVRQARAVARQGVFCEQNEDALANAALGAVRALMRDLAPAPPAPSGGARRAWMLTAAGLGAALAAGAVTADMLAWTAYQDEQRASAAGDRAGWQEGRDASLQRGRIANGLYAGAAVALGLGAYLWFARPRPLVAGVAPVDGGAVVVMRAELP